MTAFPAGIFNAQESLLVFLQIRSYWREDRRRIKSDSLVALEKVLIIDGAAILLFYRLETVQLGDK